MSDSKKDKELSKKGNWPLIGPPGYAQPDFGYGTFSNRDVQTEQEELSSRSWMPPVDIQVSEDSYHLQAELPGLTKDDINITLEDNVLRLSGERRFEKIVESEVHRVERTYGTFTRSFTLPGQIDAELVTAEFKNGVLSIRIPKIGTTRHRKVTIS